MAEDEDDLEDKNLDRFFRRTRGGRSSHRGGRFGGRNARGRGGVNARLLASDNNEDGGGRDDDQAFEACGTLFFFFISAIISGCYIACFVFLSNFFF